MVFEGMKERTGRERERERERQRDRQTEREREVFSLKGRDYQCSFGILKLSSSSIVQIIFPSINHFKS